MLVDLGEWDPSIEIRAKIRGVIPRVTWDPEELINGHILLAGSSGTGKTHTIRKICTSMVRTAHQPLRIHIFDVHDDIDVGEGSEVTFSESNDVGINPLSINPDPHCGGVRKAIQEFISAINRSSRKLGERQEAVMRALLLELYALNGFHQDKPETWDVNSGSGYGGKKRKQPTITDLARWANHKYKQAFIGGDGQATSALSELNRQTARLQRSIKESGGKDDHTLAPFKTAAIESYNRYIQTINTGKELDDLLKFDNKNTLKSVVDRIENLKSCRIFGSRGLPFSPSQKVWRYRLKHLPPEEKVMFVHFRLRELYLEALQRGEQEHIVEVIVLDEANRFMDDSPDNPLSIMANEIRKFGTALVCASQSFTHFSDDFLVSVGTKIILGIDEMYWDKSAKQLQIKKDVLQAITPKVSALIQLKRCRGKLAKIKWFNTIVSSAPT